MFLIHLLSITDGVKEITEEWVKLKLNTYGEFLFGLLVGMIVIALYHRVLGNRHLRKNHERAIKEKDKVLCEYKILISEKLEKGLIKRRVTIHAFLITSNFHI